MPRHLVRRVSRHIQARRDEWYLRVFGHRLTDTRLWSMNRHSITAAFGAGLAISFIPLPVHLPLILIASIVWRLNVPVGIVATYMVNPFTMVPIYYGAYRVGAWLLQRRIHHFEFHLTWQWLGYGLGPLWKPFLLGCLVCSILAGVLGRYALALIWRVATLRRYHTRRLRLLSHRPQG